MGYFTLDIQLNVDTGRGPLGEAAYVWFDTLTQALAPAERAKLAGLPAVTGLDPSSADPQGEPGELYGLIEVARSIDGGYPGSEWRHLSDAGWEWLRAELTDLPNWKVTVRIGRFDEDGFLGDRILSAGAWPMRQAALILDGEPPGWLVLDADVPADRFTDPDSGPAEQQRWLAAIRQAADRLNPGFGQVDYWRDKGRTALERWSGRENRDPKQSILRTRERLRGYSWLTIVAQEVGDRLGGRPALLATGAFEQVEPLTEGGFWLLATKDFRDYEMTAAERVFRALAPALPPGTPRARNDPGRPPTFVVIADPAQA
ncbi:hypothetical protein [Actinoplanes sp. L3-i22]|uniref:hypothetical protein n=1 Tax=Actinoplanes sp. L3-i22 TaxID=2836373 RepID=UPI001C756133|nr:hypothetical protein [Actinoplanes sp. L3-i22]BCY07077.1 hypothetical protein L3i22_021650 [Actinoplanes sp. L3-i22]